jgi:hypothetical protein
MTGESNESHEGYECDVCGEEFPDERSLHDHLYSIGLIH